MRSRRTDFQFPQECFNHRSSTLNLQLNPTIVEIANTPRQIKFDGAPCRERTKSYSLHTTDHENVRSNRRFIGRLSHVALPKSVCISYMHGFTQRILSHLFRGVTYFTFLR